MGSRQTPCCGWVDILRQWTRPEKERVGGGWGGSYYFMAHLVCLTTDPASLARSSIGAGEGGGVDKKTRRKTCLHSRPGVASWHVVKLRHWNGNCRHRLISPLSSLSFVSCFSPFFCLVLRGFAAFSLKPTCNTYVFFQIGNAGTQRELASGTLHGDRHELGEPQVV